MTGGDGATILILCICSSNYAHKVQTGIGCVFQLHRYHAHEGQRGKSCESVQRSAIEGRLARTIGSKLCVRTYLGSVEPFNAQGDDVVYVFEIGAKLARPSVSHSN